MLAVLLLLRWASWFGLVLPCVDWCELFVSNDLVFGFMVVFGFTVLVFAELLGGDFWCFDEIAGGVEL